MFCIAAFIVLFICGVFSGTYRPMARKAWHCVLRRVTFRPCDINFSEEVKGKMLGRLILTHPRLARFLDRWIDWFAWVFVGLSLWSLAAVLLAGLNLMIYDTCDPQKSENCSLSGEACSISTYEPTLWEQTRAGRPQQWFIDKAKTLAETVSLIPARFHDWKPEDYITPENTWYAPFDPAKPKALEIIDPGCSACAKLFSNIKAAGFENRYNITYIAYPIPDKANWSGYKFWNSHLIASYLEAMKQVKPAAPAGTVPPDWRMLERIYTGTDSSTGTKWQVRFDEQFDPEQARAAMEDFCREFGYSDEQIPQIRMLAESPQTEARLREHSAIVQRIHTVKIPTIIFGGRRYDRVLTPDKLK